MDSKAQIQYPYVADPVYQSDGWRMILDERSRQIHIEGFSPSMDCTYPQGRLAAAGKSYELAHNAAEPLPRDWPFHHLWWKPSNNPIRNFVRAGALYIAEADRAMALDPAGSTRSHCMAEAKRMAEAINILQKVTLCDLTMA